MTEKQCTKEFCDCIMGFQEGMSEIIQAPRTLWDFQLFENKEAFDAGIVKDAWQCANLVTNQGKNALNDIMFNGATQITAWKMMLFESNTEPALAMTYAVPVFTESAAYGEAARPAYQSAASSSQSITNTANRATFTMNATKTIYGCALVGGGSAAGTKSDTAGGGTLYAVSKFAVPKDVIATNILYIGMTITQV